MTTWQKWLNYLLLIIFIIILVEFSSFAISFYLKRTGIFYQPVEKPDYNKYLKNYHPILGWPSKRIFGQDGFHDTSGSRIIPAYPDPQQSPNCISLYGDSFTEGAEVDNQHAWSNILSQLVQCRVANFGASGYGTDQALLRFKHNTIDQAPIVFINHLSENILRNVNQYRDLIYYTAGLGFKPRYIINSQGLLELVPLPKFPPNLLGEVSNNPNHYFQHEYFTLGGPAGTLKASFPYILSTLKIFNHFHIRAKLQGRPWYTDFYSPQHKSNGLAVTTAILADFHQYTQAQNKTPILTIIPTGPDLLYFQKHHYWTYQPLIDALNQQKLDVLNFGTYLMQKHGQDPCRLFDNCSAHYNEKGYALLAKIAYHYLQQKNLIAK